MNKSHFEEGHSHEYVWWRLTNESYQPYVLREIADKTGGWYYPDEIFVQGSAYVIETTALFTTSTEVVDFLSNHAHECNYLIPSVRIDLPVRFHRIVTLTTGVQLWVNEMNLRRIVPDVEDNLFIDEYHAADMLQEHNHLAQDGYTLLHTPKPKFDPGDKARIIGKGDHYPMNVMARIWLDHPFSKKHLRHWQASARNEGVMVCRDNCQDKSWIYLLEVIDANLENGYAIVSEKNLKYLTREDIEKITANRSTSLSEKHYMLDDSPESLFVPKDKIVWFPRYSDDTKGFLTYGLMDGNRRHIPFEALGLKRPFLSEVNARLDTYFWLEHPSSYAFLDYLEQEARKRGYWTFVNFNRKRSKVWIYAITISIEGTPHIFFVPEEQLKKSQVDYVDFIRSAENPETSILIEQVNQLSLKKLKFWDAALHPPTDMLCEQEYLGKFTIVPMIANVNKENEYE